MDGTRLYYAKRNKSIRERQTPYDFIHVEFKKQNRGIYGGGGEERETNHKRLLMIENKPWVDEGGVGLMSDGY